MLEPVTYRGITAHRRLCAFAEPHGCMVKDAIVAIEDEASRRGAVVERERLIAEARAAAKLEGLRRLVGEQAEDQGLWFISGTAPEAYLQQELRRLHDAIEAEE